MEYLMIFVGFRQRKTKPILSFSVHRSAFCVYEIEKTKCATWEAGAIQQVTILPGQNIADRPE